MLYSRLLYPCTVKAYIKFFILLSHGIKAVLALGFFWQPSLLFHFRCGSLSCSIMLHDLHHCCGLFLDSKPALLFFVLTTFIAFIFCYHFLPNLFIYFVLSYFVLQPCLKLHSPPTLLLQPLLSMPRYPYTLKILPSRSSLLN